MEKSDYEPNQRAHYRLQYPLRERPLLVVGTSQYAVIELSEGGLRVQGNVSSEEIDGLLKLKDGTVCEVTGKVGRKLRDETVVINLEGVSFAVLMSEQRRLVSRYLRA
ncbi:MAG: PilZ domain-containing protein [Planctomycetales bacterium]|nr:PilZ domain-containing protein [Planctomycetales bacterium]